MSFIFASKILHCSYKTNFVRRLDLNANGFMNEIKSG